MKTLVKLKSPMGKQTSTVKMARTADGYEGKERAEYSFPIAGVTGDFQPTGQSHTLDFKLISDTPITYRAFLSLPDGNFKCKVTIYYNQSKSRQYAAVTECKFKAGRS